MAKTTDQPKKPKTAHMLNESAETLSKLLEAETNTNVNHFKAPEIVAAADDFHQLMVQFCSFFHFPSKPQKKPQREILAKLHDNLTPTTVRMIVWDFIQHTSDKSPESALYVNQMKSILPYLLELREIKADFVPNYKDKEQKEGVIEASDSETANARKSNSDVLEILEDAVILRWVKNLERVYPYTKEEPFSPNRIAPSSTDDKSPSKSKMHDKHMFGLFVPGSLMPLVMVSTQLVEVNNGKSDDPYAALPHSIRPILGAKPHLVRNPDGMIFYSISSNERSPLVKSLSLGEVLINRVAETVTGQVPSKTIEPIPSLRVFSTLSPVKEFNDWLCEGLTYNRVPLLQVEKNGLEAISKRLLGQSLPPQRMLKKLVEEGKDDLDQEEVAFVDRLLEDLCLEYLFTAKNEVKGKTFLRDSVAHFHCRNGAVPAYISAQGDEKAWDTALGITVNYVYDLEKREAASMAYKQNGTFTIAPPLYKRLTTRRKQIASENNLNIQSADNMGKFQSAVEAGRSENSAQRRR